MVSIEGFVKLLDENQTNAAVILCKNDSHLPVNQEIGTIGDQKTEIIMEFLLDPNSVKTIAEKYDYTASSPDHMHHWHPFLRLLRLLVWALRP